LLQLEPSLSSARQSREGCGTTGILKTYLELDEDGRVGNRDHSDIDAKKHRGSRAELLASAWLLGQGFEVFWGISQHGLADLIAYDPRAGTYIPADVKCHTSNHSRSGPRKLSDRQKQLGVRKILVDLESGTVRWAPESNVVVMKKRAA
jgi:hypothetical protein